MIGTLFSSVASLASSYLEGKTAIQKAEATIRMKEATGEIDWDLAAMRASTVLVEGRMVDPALRYSSCTKFL